MLINYIVLVFYLGILLLIGVLAARQVKDIKDYYVGGKKLGYWVVAFSSRATGSSAWVLLGLSGMGAIWGVFAYWVVIGTVSGVAISWFVMGKPFKRLTDHFDSITIPDYLESRFQATSHRLRLVAAIALTFFVTIYVSAQIDATGTAFESFLGWNYYTGAIVGFIIVVLYMSFGGFIAVAWSDVFQGGIMLLGLVALPLVMLTQIPSDVASAVGSVDADLLSFWGPGGFSLLNLTKIIGFVMIGLGFLGSPQLFVRYMSIKSEAEIDRGKWVSVLLTFTMNFSAVSLGILGRALFTSSGEDPTTTLGNGGQEVLLYSADQLLPAVIGSFYIAAVLSAIMSTIDSLLVIASSSVSRDLYQKVYHPQLSDNALSTFSKKTTLFLAIMSLLVALAVAYFSPTRTIFWFVIFGWSGIAATFCPMMILSLFWNKYTEQGALASMITGFLSVPLFKFLLPQWEAIAPYLTNMAELFPSFIISLLVGYIISVKAHSVKSG
ncbi:MAG: sodium/proline symporter [Bacteroidota bacterium]